MSPHRPLANDPLASTWSAGLRSALRGYARAHLPEPMVPAHFVVLPELPKLPNGKVDRASLPAPSAEAETPSDYVAPRTAVEARLAGLWQDLLGSDRVGVETGFFDLGGDSLTVLRMAGQVKEAYGVRVDLRRLFEEPTVAHLARMVGDQPDVVVSEAASPRGVAARDMAADATLPDDVRPTASALPPASAPYRTVLLTGGTGYTGAFLLRELLERSTATVYVLVRAEDPARATERVRANLAEYGLLREDDAARVRGVPGDTGRPYLGLTPSTYRELAERVEMIVHNAAISSWLVPYPKIKPVNVLGALEVLRLAGRTRVKPVHFVSTTGVYPGHRGARTWPEERLTVADGVAGGYRQSKWVADNLMTSARERGIPTHVYRPSPITGARTTGVCSADTFINHLIKGCLQLGAYLDFDMAVDLVPVDFVAASVAHIALGGVREHGVFNLPGAGALGMNRIFELITECGYRLRKLPYDAWYGELTDAAARGEDNELIPYLPLFGPEGPAEEVGFAGSRPEFDATHLSAALAGSGITCPPVDRDLMGRYLSYFVSTGYLPAPDGDGPDTQPGPEPLERTTMTTSTPEAANPTAPTPAPEPNARPATDAVPDFPMPRAHPLDPPPAYRELSAAQPVFRVRTPRGELVWVVTRHEDARAVLTDLRVSSDPKSPGYPSYISGDTPLPPGFFLNQDPPDHTRLRRLVTREFLISQMERKRPAMRRVLDGLLDDLQAKGPGADLIGGLAFPMAATVMCELLDVPYEDKSVFITLTDTVLDRSSTPEQAENAASELMAYFDRLVTAKKRAPGDDMLGRLAEQEANGTLSHDEFVGLVMLLLLSGYDTMAQMIGLGTATLLEHPTQLADLRADPALYPRAVEELLRYLSINHAGLPRAATRDLTVGGQHIRAGEGLLVMLNAANRDASVFPEPDVFDIHRASPQAHVAFGHGFHKCIGLTLARVELTTVFAGLFERFPTLRLGVPLTELPFRHDMVLYGLRELPVTW
ncbi:thioester reductase domain-containing protein [Streptomyces buecherae]|uniref:thioester reductase domain-containing protein n=2 Tax=Streptomyces buecherae TaxID=2763006 RepID=UPI0018DA17B4|nr:thioester reductase domain-containing protein [Streptomyces buecherae]